MNQEIQYQRYRFIGPLIAFVVVINIFLSSWNLEALTQALNNSVNLTYNQTETIPNTFISISGFSLLLQIFILAIGFISSDALSYLVYNIFHFFWNHYTTPHDGYERLYMKLRNYNFLKAKQGAAKKLDSVFTYFFNVYVNQKVREWILRRFSIYFGSITASISIYIGLLCSAPIYYYSWTDFHFAFLVLFIIITLFLTLNGLKAKESIIDMIDYWLDTDGKKNIIEGRRCPQDD